VKFLLNITQGLHIIFNFILCFKCKKFEDGEFHGLDV
jgi:hypothetical protein